MESGDTILIDNPSQYFYVNNGAVLRNMHELLAELNKMDDATFQHHVNSEKNDFSNWVENVLKEPTLAKKISSAKSISETMKAIETKLKKRKAGAGKNKRAIISGIKASVNNE